MKLTQSWVGYLDRSYQQIKSSCLARLTVNNPEISDHNESNIFIIILSMFAGIAEMLNYYIDMMAREGYLGTAKRFTSVIRLARLVDYNGKAATAASADITFTLVNSSGVPIVAAVPLTIPKDTIVTDANGIVFRTLIDVIIPIGLSYATAEAIQWQDVTNDLLGLTDGTPRQQILLPTDYVEGTLTLFINGDFWSLYTSFGFMDLNNLGFITQLQDDGNIYIVFGDGVNGKIPDIGQNVYGTYKVTEGAGGNLPPDSLTQITQFAGTLPANTTLKASNFDYSNGGGGVETIEEIRNRAPRSIRTLDRAVTYQDFVDMATLVPEVSEAEASFCCGKTVDIYIIPRSRGNATTALVQKVTDFLNCKKEITTQPNVLSAGVSRMYMSAIIWGKPLYAENSILIEVINLLDAKFGFANSSINGKVSVSDIVSVMESAKSVDHVDIEYVKIVPYARPLKKITVPLNIDFINIPGPNTNITYTIRYRSISNTFVIFRGGSPMGTISTGSQFDSIQDGMSFKINGGGYADGDTWQFTIVGSYPKIFPSTVLNVSDFTMPIFDIGPLVDTTVPKTFYSNLTVKVQTSQNNCLPPCQ